MCIQMLSRFHNCWNLVAYLNLSKIGSSGSIFVLIIANISLKCFSPILSWTMVNVPSIMRCFWFNLSLKKWLVDLLRNLYLKELICLHNLSHSVFEFFLSDKRAILALKPLILPLTWLKYLSYC